MAKRMVLINIANLYGKTSAIDTEDSAQHRHRNVPICGNHCRMLIVCLWLGSEVPAVSKVGPVYPRQQTFERRSQLSP
jgi:hypothetical protein